MDKISRSISFENFKKIKEDIAHFKMKKRSLKCMRICTYKRIQDPNEPMELSDSQIFSGKMWRKCDLLQYWSYTIIRKKRKREKENKRMRESSKIRMRWKINEKGISLHDTSSIILLHINYIYLSFQITISINYYLPVEYLQYHSSSLPRNLHLTERARLSLHSLLLPLSMPKNILYDS